MSLQATLNEITFGVGDVVRVIQKVKESGDKTRLQAFEGTVLGISGRGVSKTFMVRRIGAQRVGIEKIFPVSSPSIDKVEVVRKGTKGVRSAKLYFIRRKSSREIEKIYSRASKKDQPQKPAKKKAVKVVAKKKLVSKTSSKSSKK